MISTKNVLPNFLKTVLFAAIAATSISTFAGHHEKGEKIGELKDMKKKTTMLKKDEMKSSISEEAGDVKSDVMHEKDKVSEEAEAIKAEAPEG
ncbi:hypothetical protein NBRC116583_17550 [Arenicella sp. 4NH20-0111]|uniref:hypothetical protein n=1 Tax=Arenicella sp. 4NH20-0111 TaxID=3127648 RepID=UPI00310A6EAE